jgi:predicted dehydrogenase
MTACGAGGVLEWDALRNTVTLQRADGSAEDCTEPQSREAMFAAQADAFIEAVSGGSDDDRLATGLEGVRALALCDAARRADASRREEPVEYL